MSEVNSLERSMPLEQAEQDQGAQVSLSGPNLEITLNSEVGLVNIQRICGLGPALLGQAAKEISLPLSTEPNVVMSDNPQSQVFWMAPDHWLARIDSDASVLTEKVNAVSDELGVYASDLSQQLVELSFQGTDVRSLLAKSCSLDLSPETFGVGTSARTLLHGQRCILWREEEDAFRILIDHSFADYLWQWLSEAGQEFFQ